MHGGGCRCRWSQFNVEMAVLVKGSLKKVKVELEFDVFRIGRKEVVEVV